MLVLTISGLGVWLGFSKAPLETGVLGLPRLRHASGGFRFFSYLCSVIKRERYMPSMFISGRDVAIDTSFFINGLNADAETITIRTDDDETFVNFVVDGQRYTAKWYDWNNSIRITCDDLNYDEYEVADRKLYELSKRFTNDVFDNLFVRKNVVWAEGDKPVLLVLLYEK